MSRDAGETLVRSMCHEIVHRGPDDEGYAVFDRVGLGMRRLSIIDLAGGHQPVSSDDGARHIVFNGEIYNYREVRERLIATGRAFRTASDTEVILQQIDEHGPPGVHAFNGMYAFAHWDDRKKELFVVRDRLGVKPLYYAFDGRRLVFASEIKAILAAGHPRKLDTESLWHYLTFRYVPQPRSIWKGVHKLLPGHTLTISARRPEPVVERYWRSPGEERPPRERVDWTDEFSTLFDDAVRLRLVADVPVGVLLSGGLDSTAVLAAAARLHDGPVKTFSIGYEGRFVDDERRYARLAADAVGAEHSEVEMGDRDFLDFMPRLPHFTDDPLADLAAVPLYYVSQLAAKHVKVVLSGEGSDEVLGGYDLDRAARRWKGIAWARRVPSWVREVARGTGPARWTRLLEEINVPEAKWFEPQPPTMSTAYSSADKRALLQPHVAEACPDSLDLVRDDFRHAPAGSRLGQLLDTYQQSWMVEDLLMKADRMTMANSLELRVPFLDYRLVEWAARAPDEVKVRRTGVATWTTKWVLRAAYRDKIPAAILDRPKRGFPLPAYDRLSTTMKSWAEAMLSPDAFIHRWLHGAEVHRALVDGTAPGASDVDRRRLWALLTLEAWARCWEPVEP